MPANRSKTERWRDQLDLILARRGGLEISFAPDSTPGPDLIWRVRLIRLSDDEIVVEAPGAAGSSVQIPIGSDLLVGMQVGQNRWMFSTRVLGAIPMSSAPDGRALRLAMPQSVERCRRRSFHRVSTASLSLPMVEVWPVLDPSTIPLAEIANRTQLQEATRGGTGATTQSVLPEVAPSFRAELLNISGGGVGLLIAPSEAAALDLSRILWMRIDLRPRIAAPIGVTARVAHTHRDSEQNLHAGLAFEFQFNPPHRAFVVEQICRYVEAYRQSHPGAAEAA